MKRSQISDRHLLGWGIARGYGTLCEYGKQVIYSICHWKLRYSIIKEYCNQQQTLK